MYLIGPIPMESFTMMRLISHFRSHSKTFSAAILIPMPQRLGSIYGVIELFQVVENTHATFIPSIHYGMTRAFHSSAKMNVFESKAVSINDKNSSSATISGSSFGL